MTDRPDPAAWIANARSLTQSSSIPLGVPVNTHMDMLLRDTRRDLQAACDALEAVLDLAREWEDSSDLLHPALRPHTRSRRLRDAIETALRGDS